MARMLTLIALLCTVALGWILFGTRAAAHLILHAAFLLSLGAFLFGLLSVLKKSIRSSTMSVHEDPPAASNREEFENVRSQHSYPRPEDQPQNRFHTIAVSGSPFM